MVVTRQQMGCATQTEPTQDCINSSINESTFQETPPASTSTPQTPTRKRRKTSTPNMENTCRKCNVSYRTKMDDDYGSDWINCARRNCTY